MKNLLRRMKERRTTLDGKWINWNNDLIRLEEMGAEKSSPEYKIASSERFAISAQMHELNGWIDVIESEIKNGEGL